MRRRATAQSPRRQLRIRVRRAASSNVKINVGIVEGTHLARATTTDDEVREMKFSSKSGSVAATGRRDENDAGYRLPRRPLFTSPSFCTCTREARVSSSTALVSLLSHSGKAVKLEITTVKLSCIAARRNSPRGLNFRRANPYGCFPSFSPRNGITG